MSVFDNDNDDDIFISLLLLCSVWTHFLPHDKFSKGVCMTFDFYVIQFEAVHNHLIFQLSVIALEKEI